MKVMLTAVVGAVLLATLTGQSATTTSMQFDCPPRDEALRDHQLVAVRAKLRQAVAARDASGVLAVAHPDIRTSFGTDDGLEFFKRDLADQRSELWEELSAVLSLGGYFEAADTFVAPFSHACGEAGKEVVVVGRLVRVRSHPQLTASVLSRVSFAVLRRRDDDSRPHWQSVQLPDGTRGFIAAQFVRDRIGYRARFTKIDGVWRLTAFIAGD